MVIEMNKNPLSNCTERYTSAGLSVEFVGEMAKAIAAIQLAGYEPYDQLYGYVKHENDINFHIVHLYVISTVR